MTEHADIAGLPFEKALAEKGVNPDDVCGVMGYAATTSGLICFIAYAAASLPVNAKSFLLISLPWPF